MTTGMKITFIAIVELSKSRSIIERYVTGIPVEEVEALARTIERSWWKRLYLGLKYGRWLF